MTYMKKIKIFFFILFFLNSNLFANDNTDFEKWKKDFKHRALANNISEQTIKAAELTYNANQTAYKGTVIEQEVGERSVLDVLTARQSLLNSEIKYFQEQKDREITKAQVMYMSGTLNLSSLGIN
mgnify:CR=1 FL=1